MNATLVWILLLIFWLPSAFAAKRYSSVMSLTARSTYISDIQSAESEAEPMKFGQAYEVELGLRMKSFFEFIIVGYRTPSSSRSGIGVGFRVGLPGFFWLGGRDTDFLKSARNWPVNTSIFGALVQSSVKNESGTSDSSNDSNMGLSIDIYPWSSLVFLTGQASVLISQGNSYSSLGGGLGMEF